MEWTQAMTIIVSMLALIFGMLLVIISDIWRISRDIAAESRDFHGRLCRLEERYKEMKGK